MRKVDPNILVVWNQQSSSSRHVSDNFISSLHEWAAESCVDDVVAERECRAQVPGKKHEDVSKVGCLLNHS